MARIASVEALERLYGTPSTPALRKVAHRIIPDYRAIIEASPFVALATSGPEGLDVSPRGDAAGRLVRIADEKTLILPDRFGNNRIDSLRNVVRDPRLALMFLVPGWANALRVNGRGHVDDDPALLASFAVESKAPRSCLVIEVDEVYFQCARAVMRSGLWSGAAAPALPSVGQMLAHLTQAEVGGDDYDRTWAERASNSLW